jgi:hypothetical protein
MGWQQSQAGEWARPERRCVAFGKEVRSKPSWKLLSAGLFTIHASPLETKINKGEQGIMLLRSRFRVFAPMRTGISREAAKGAKNGYGR